MGSAGDGTNFGDGVVKNFCHPTTPTCLCHSTSKIFCHPILKNVLLRHPSKDLPPHPPELFVIPSKNNLAPLSQNFCPQNKKNTTHLKFLFASSPPKCFLPPHSQKIFLLSPCYHPSQQYVIGSVSTFMCDFSALKHLWKNAKRPIKIGSNIYA